MEKINRLNELNDLMLNFWHEGFPAILILVVLISLSVFFSCFDVKETSKKGTIIFSLIMLSFIGYIVYASTSEGKYREEVIVLEQELFNELREERTVIVETKDIANSTTVRNHLCPHYDLSDTEEIQCTYVEFVTDGKISQVLIPLSKSPYASVEDSFKLKYYDLTKEERKYFSEKLGLADGLNRGYVTFDLEGWSFGESVE